MIPASFYTSKATVLPLLLFFTINFFSMLSFSSVTWEMIPTIRHHKKAAAKYAQLVLWILHPMQPKPSSMNMALISTPPAVC